VTSCVTAYTAAVADIPIPEFPAITRLRWIFLQYWDRGCERAAEARINASTISTCWFKKLSVNNEICEPLFIMERSKGANVDIYLKICVCLYSLRWANAYQNQASLLLYRISFPKGLFYKQTHALAVLLQRKYCLRFVYGWKFYYQLRIRHLDILLKI